MLESDKPFQYLTEVDEDEEVCEEYEPNEETENA